MTPTWTEVNAAILAVLGEFGRTGRPSGRSSIGRDPVFVDRLFSLRHAEAMGDGPGEVRVLSGTVVTPLARDYLNRRRVAIRVVSGREAAAARGRLAGEWGLAIESRSGPVEAFRRTMLDAWAEVGPGPVEAAHWVVDGEGRGALVVADEASLAAWRAGRVEGIRAATVAEPDAASRAARHLGANLIVVEPAGKSIHLLKEIGERFRRAGAPEMPEGLDVFEEPGARARWPR